MAKSGNVNVVWGVVAGVLAWVIPGAGHAFLGRWIRGAIIFLCINGLFWSGVYVGGVFTVDPIKEKWWYMAQMCTGASGVYSLSRQAAQRAALVAEDRGLPPETPAERAWGRRNVSSSDVQQTVDRLAAEKGLALVDKGDQVARAYSGIAGMLNILCIFDALMLGLMGRRGEPVPPRSPQEDRP